MTEERVEACAAYWATPEGQRAETVLEFGKVWGLSAAKVREARSDKRVLKRVTENLRMEATYLAAQVLKIKGAIALDTKHRDCDKAGNTILRIAEVLDSGPMIQNNTQLISPTVYEAMSDEDVRDAVTDMAEKEGWIRKRVEPEGE
jgi:predicted polyphosphate/ATP-dependent NAD kinase